jgi:TonB family protein
MNGSARATFFTFGRPLSDAHLVTRWDRVFAALMASCLLHMLAVVAPALGTSAMPKRAVSSLAPSGAQADALEVRLEESRATAPKDPQTGNPARTTGRQAASRGVDLLPFPAHLYPFRTTDELTKHPRPRVKPVFNVPAPAFTPGKVVLRVWIDALGNVLAVDVEKSTVPEALAASAASAFRQTPFIPGEINSRHVATLMRIEVTYADGVTFNVSR